MTYNHAKVLERYEVAIDKILHLTDNAEPLRYIKDMYLRLHWVNKTN